MEHLLDPLKQSPPAVAIPDMLREWKVMGENMLKSLVDHASEIESREKKIAADRDSLEEREEQLYLAYESSKGRVESRERELDERLKLVNLHIERLETEQSEFSSLRLLEREKLKAVEQREKTIDQRETDFNLFKGEILSKEEVLNREREGFAEKLKAIEKREKSVEQREKDFNLSNDKRLREIVSKEEVLRREEKDFAEKLKAIEKREKTIEQREKDIKLSKDKEGKDFAEKLKAIEKREKTIEQREKDFNLSKDKRLRDIISKEEVLSWKGKDFAEKLEAIEKREKTIEQREKDIKLSKDKEGKDFAEKLKAIEKREKTMEQREKDFNLSKDKRLREIVCKEEVLSRDREKFRGVVERFDSGLILFEGLKVKTDQEFKSLNAISNEAGLIGESLEKRFEEMEKEIISVHEDKMQELELKERELSSVQKEIETREVSVRAREKEAKSSCELVNIRLQELEELEKKFEKNKERKMGELVLAEEKLRLVGEGFIQAVKTREEKFDAQEKMIHGLLERLELARKNVSHMNALVSERFKKTRFKETRVKLDEDVALSGEKVLEGTKKESQLKDFEKDLEMIINDTEKDMELISADVFVVLLLCSDPAKLVLDAITRFCVPCLGKGDVEVNVWRKSVVLLDQLTKTSPSIQPCVKEGAKKVAFEWKAKMKCGNNSLEVLGFLHLLAAYNLSFCFYSEELLSLLNMVAQQKQAPVLCCILGLAENIHGFVQNLINEKRYLLASTYIHECGLESMFPQAAVLKYHVEHLKAKRKRENTSPEALDKAFASEIADLRLAVEHVIKYGLESEYSPDVLKERIKTLEGNRTSTKRFSRVRAAQQASSPAWNSENRPYPAWKARNWQSKPIAATKCFEAPMTHSNMTSKRQKLARGWVEPNKCAPLDTVVHVTN